MSHFPDKSAPAWRETLLAVLLIAAGAGLAYHNTFAVPFLFDDHTSIRDNPTIRSLGQAWWPPADHGRTVSGRPLLNLTLALNQAVSGSEVWSYHALNLLIHVAAGITLFAVVRRTLRRPALAERFGRDAGWLALATALLWTLHPLQTGAVTYIIQRAESLVSLCYVVTLWCFIRSVEPGAAKKWPVLAVIACLCGMAAKEVMVTAPVMIALYDRIFVAGSWREVWRQRGRFHLALAATWLLLAVLVVATGSRGGTAGFGSGVSPLDYALTQVGAVVHYLRLAVWPRPLIFDYGRAEETGGVLFPALVLLPLLVASLYGAWRSRPAGYGGLFFFVVLAPSSSVVPIATQAMSEHRVYLALGAVIVLGVTGLYSLVGRKSLVVFAGLALALGVATEHRNRDYQTEAGLWADTVAKRPGNARAAGMLAGIHDREGRWPEARAVLQESVRINPRSAEAHRNLGTLYMMHRRWAEAIESFEVAVRLKPDDVFALNNLGNMLLQAGRVPEGLAQFEAAIRVDPHFPEARYNLANTLAQNGRLAEAATHYAALLELTPDDAEARANYDSVLRALARAPRAK